MKASCGTQAGQVCRSMTSAPEYIADIERAEAGHKNAWNKPGNSISW
jgi:hypothetical protein